MALLADFVSGQSNVTYTRFRELLLESGGGLQEGVVGATDVKPAQRGAGANQSVDIPAGAAWIQIDTGTRNGISHAYNDAVANVTVAAADATNPRIDQACLQYNDTAIPAGTGGNLPTFRILTGTATAGATLDNRTGAAALPNDCLRLADILVPAASTSVVTANIRDRRPWARGALWTLQAAGPVAIGTTAAQALDSARIECSGAPVEIEISGQFSVLTALVNTTLFQGVDSTYTFGRTWNPPATGTPYPFTVRWVVTPASGSHVLAIGASVSSATGTLSVSNYTVMYRETVRQNASNT